MSSNYFSRKSVKKLSFIPEIIIILYYQHDPFHNAKDVHRSKKDKRTHVFPLSPKLLALHADESLPMCPKEKKCNTYFKCLYC